MDGEKRRVSGAAALLILLAIASFATAAITITNITHWTVRAQTPPIVKVQGADAINTDYIYTSVTWEVNSDGTNRTLITITGFRGDPTKYDEIIKICNKDNVTSYNVELQYRGRVSGNWTYVKWIRFWIAGQGPLEITQSGSTGSAATTIPGGQCASVSVEVLVDGSLPDNMLGKDLLTIQIDVVSIKPTP
ncbi:MAG: hypothetical protein QW067_05285 [Thermofilaceae archaeon]